MIALRASLAVTLGSLGIRCAPPQHSAYRTELASQTRRYAARCHAGLCGGGAVSTANRYSLWLVPDAGAVNDDLQAIIDRLAGEHGGPTFPPHLTLLSGIVAPEDDVVERARRLAAASAPITLHLDDIRADETYFQSLFAVVRPTPELVGLRAAARTVFPEAPDPYRPHVSLLYGHPSAETKQAI